MTELLTAAQMKAIEQAAIESGDVTGLELMERAGRGVVEAVFEEWPELAKTSHRAVVLCGPGNNGGDGFVVARLLKEWGWEVEVFLYGDADKLPPDARVNCERWLEMGCVFALDEDNEYDCVADLWIDAFFGTGLSRPIPQEVWNALFCVEANVVGTNVKSVAIDIPSFLCADSGKPIGSEVNDRNHLTVTFHSLKPGHLLDRSDEFCGKVIIKDIGLEVSDTANDIEYVEIENSYSGYLRKLEGHKYAHGHALILSGPSGKGGAARLAARGALRIGAGVVTVGCVPDAVAENAAQLNAIMLEAVYDGDALKRVLQDERINALCLGPGLGGERAEALLPVVLADGGVEPRPTVLDADALTCLSEDEALFGLLHENCILTPHAGEFTRLFPDIAEKLNAPATKGPAYSKVDATGEAAKRAGCVVLFKGADTVIAGPDGRCSINSAHYERSAPWLATAGSGDVLAGFITGLLARGFEPMQAAETAAWLHVECALSFGAGLIAEDLSEELPKVFAKLQI